jgi:hypothetical protein
MADAPKQIVKVQKVDRGLMSKEIYAVDAEGNVWRRTEGFGRGKWWLAKKAGVS